MIAKSTTATLNLEMTADELKEKEMVIERGKQTFIEVGRALSEIRDRRGYRFKYSTWDEYLDRRWHWGRTQAHYMIEASRVVSENVQTFEQNMPSYSQAIELSKLEPAQVVGLVKGVNLDKTSVRQLKQIINEKYGAGIITCPDCGKLYDGDTFSLSCPYCTIGGRNNWIEQQNRKIEPAKPRVNWSEYAVSASDDETQIIKWIMDLYNAGQPFDLDPTYSTGRFWQGLIAPHYRSDLMPECPGIMQADSRHLPYADSAILSIMFDPPFIAKDTTEREPNGIIESRFTGFKSVGELWAFYNDSLMEFYRILQAGGLLAFKCMDIISGGEFHASHIEIVNQARQIGFHLEQIFILYRKSVLMSPNMANQIHARHNHSFFLVFTKDGTE